MEDVSDLVAAVVERDPTGRWFATVADRRLRAGDDLHLVEPLLRLLMPAVTRVGDLLNIATNLHFDRAAHLIDWDRLATYPEPWTTPASEWPSMTHGGDNEPRGELSGHRVHRAFARRTVSGHRVHRAFAWRTGPFFEAAPTSGLQSRRVCVRFSPIGR